VAAHRLKKCSQCDKKVSPAGMKQHLAWHKREDKKHKTNCEKCGKILKTKYGSGRFCGSGCARSFSTSKNRDEISKKTAKTLTGDEAHLTKSVECPNCNKSFTIRLSQSQKYCSRLCVRQFQYDQRNPNYKKNKAAARQAGKKGARKQRRTRRSKNEILFYEMCKKKFPDSLPNEPIFNGWDADVVIPSLKIAVMWNGVWHYRKITEAHSVKQVQNRDRIKISEIKKMGWMPYVIRDDGSYDPKFVLKKWKEFLTIAE